MILVAGCGCDCNRDCCMADGNGEQVCSWPILGLAGLLSLERVMGIRCEAVVMIFAAPSSGLPYLTP